MRSPSRTMMSSICQHDFVVVVGDGDRGGGAHKIHVRCAWLCQDQVGQRDRHGLGGAACTAIVNSIVNDGHGEGLGFVGVAV